MAELGIDEAWTRKDPAALKRDGYDFVLGYLSTDATKNMTAARAAALHAAALDVGLIWETTAARATAGYQAGVDDRKTAERQAAALHYPFTAALFWAVDSDVAPAKVLPYAKGWNAGAYNIRAANRPTGPYGSRRVIEAVHAAGLSTVEWQTEAWSGTSVSGQADLYQRIHVTRPSLGGGYDEDVLLHPVPLWYHAAAAPAPVAPKPAPKVAPVPAPPAGWGAWWKNFRWFFSNGGK